MVTSRAALLWEQPGEWKVSTVSIDEPRRGEVLVEMVATGLCHSDDHVKVGDVPAGHLPICGGHEGAGVVREVGPGVYGLTEGDHVITSFIPSCGRCKWCAQGLQQLCDNGALIMEGTQLDGTFRMHHGRTDVATMSTLGTFSEWQVFDQLSCVKVRQDVPLETLCIVACGVPTGWGSAVNGAVVRPGDVVVVMGIGGVGINAVQGAAFAGAAHVVAVDPVKFKRDSALKLGATESFADMTAATEFVRSVTNGQGADSAIVTVGVVKGEFIAEAFTAIRKAGTVVVTSQGALTEFNIPVNLFEISMYQKRIQGVLYGMSSPRESIARLIDLYAEGKLKLDEVITRRYRLDQVNEAYDDMRAGRNLRGVIEFK
ncbi:NDMA-dependent alcohol dehydrogenase [Amycolatopsis acidicola]|uniref:NDMA-dependent alcohol dehydrogenase n=1 Tax=Amycolatopsis acidicola TaxID=2596893 RepID=A0A5N0VCD2_9PSEU|nr:NDMA-dependent alcohol dehydrogenase [Amycolatopsis acidicola]KAA9164047.1 NDMA-dependent alcohol dehydrogenase [Amycolatopsis acidicola]